MLPTPADSIPLCLTAVLPRNATAKRCIIVRRFFFFIVLFLNLEKFRSVEISNKRTGRVPRFTVADTRDMSATVVESRRHDNSDVTGNIKWEDSGIVIGKPPQPSADPVSHGALLWHRFVDLLLLIFLLILLIFC